MCKPKPGSAVYPRQHRRGCSAYPKDAFTAGVAKQPKITAHKTAGVNVVNMNGRTTATATMTLTLDSGFTEQHTFPLLKESGQWKICGRPY